MAEHVMESRCPGCGCSVGRFLDREPEPLDEYCDYCRADVLNAERELVAWCEKKPSRVPELTPAQLADIVWNETMGDHNAEG